MAMRSASLLEVGQVLAGRFFIDRRLGGVEGGFGQIYVAKDIGGGPQVAIKAESIIAQVQLFRQEAEVLRQLRVLDSPNCVKLADIGSTSSCTWIATTLGGPNLAELRRQCREERFQPTTVARLAVEMLKGLEALHQVGFVHRDVKPNNFILAGDGSRRILLIDFGLCRSYRDGLSRRLLPPRAQ